MILANISFFTSEHRADTLRTVLTRGWKPVVEACPDTADAVLARMLTQPQPGVVTFCLQWKSPDLQAAEALLDSEKMRPLFDALRADFGEDALTFTSFMEVI